MRVMKQGWLTSEFWARHLANSTFYKSTNLDFIVLQPMHISLQARPQTSLATATTNASFSH